MQVTKTTLGKSHYFKICHVRLKCKDEKEEIYELCDLKKISNRNFGGQKILSLLQTNQAKHGDLFNKNNRRDMPKVINFIMNIIKNSPFNMGLWSQ